MPVVGFLFLLNVYRLLGFSLGLYRRDGYDYEYVINSEFRIPSSTGTRAVMLRWMERLLSGLCVTVFVCFRTKKVDGMQSLQGRNCTSSHFLLSKRFLEWLYLVSCPSLLLSLSDCGADYQKTRFRSNSVFSNFQRHSEHYESQKRNDSRVLTTRGSSPRLNSNSTHSGS